jgi:hypothetical protein
VVATPAHCADAPETRQACELLGRHADGITEPAGKLTLAEVDAAGEIADRASGIALKELGGESRACVWPIAFRQTNNEVFDERYSFTAGARRREAVLETSDFRGGEHGRKVEKRSRYFIGLPAYDARRGFRA